MVSGIVNFCAPPIVQAGTVEENVSILNKLAIYNFGQVSQSLWRGSIPSDKELAELAKRGVKTVVDLRYAGIGRKHEEKTANKLGLKYIHMSIGHNQLSLKEWLSFFNILSNPVNLPVYVHCTQGADRTGVIVGAYRMLVQNWSFEKTYNEMRSYHFKPFLLNMKKSVVEISNNSLAKNAIGAAVNAGP